MKFKLLFSILCFFSLLFGCAKKEETQLSPPFVDLTAFKELEDGWVAYLYIETLKKDIEKDESVNNIDFNQIQNVFFDVVNLKYDKIENFYLPVKDENGEIVDKMQTNQPSYLQSIYGDSVKSINDFLTNSKFKKIITIQDLKDCDSEIFNKRIVSKEDIVQLYNDALSHDKEFYNNFMHVPESNTLTKNLLDGSRIQFSYIKNFSDFGICRIEYIYEDETYLSDLVLHGKADEQQVLLQHRLDEIEERIIATQDVETTPLTGNEQIDYSIKLLLKEFKE